MAILDEGVDYRNENYKRIPIKGKMKDITGQKIGKLSPLFPVRSQKTQTVKWLCQCDCGNLVCVPTVHLSTTTCQTTYSCGCYSREKASARWQIYREENSIIGKTFNELTVIELVEVKDYKAFYKCKCSCGKEVILAERPIVSGNTKSCGHLETNNKEKFRTDPIGKKYSKLTVQEWVGLNKKGANIFLCRCECGNTIITDIHSLKRKNTQSCGQCIKSVGEKNIEKILQENFVHYKPQYTFTDLKSSRNGTLVYDFAILNDDNQVIRLIEFDGNQHNQPYEFFGGEEKFIKVKENDELKNNYAYSHNIPLVRIPYNKRNSISYDDIFTDTFLTQTKEENI